MKGYIPESSSITRASSSDYLVLYPGHTLGESYSSAEKQLQLTGPNFVKRQW